jgi:hypothetical protein
VPQAVLGLGTLRSCPAAAVDASGAAVVAGATRKDVRVVVRDPGGTWGAPIAFPATLGAAVTAAVSARGDVVVAWLEWGEDYRTADVRVARRAAGGAFGEPERIAADFTVEGPMVALTAAGEALLVVSDETSVRVASAAPGVAFPAPRKLLGHSSFGYEPALATTPDGRALLAAPGDGGTTLFDREPGGEFVRRPAIPSDGDVAVALGGDGSALVAWESAGRVTAMRRAGTGRFGAPLEIQGELPRRPTENSIGFYSTEGPPLEAGRLRVALGADGRGLLTWPGIETGLQAASLTPERSGDERSARGSDTAEVTTLGSPVRPAAGMTPLLLAGGTRAVAWTDGNAIESSPPYSGRLHLALDGAADAPVPAAPKLTAGAPRDRTLRPIQPLVLPFRCSAACDVRGYINGRSGGPSVALSKAGTGTLEFTAGFEPLKPKRATLKVTLSWSAPGARTASTRTIAVRIRRLPAPPLPHLLDVRARRGPGGVVDVRWRTDGPARDAGFVVIGTRTRSGERERGAPVFASVRGGTRRRSFHVRLREARAVRYVLVAVTQALGRDRIVRVRVQ